MSDEWEPGTGEKCKCGEYVGWESYHTCPFKTEIHYDCEECNCCSECQYQCAQDI